MPWYWHELHLWDSGWVHRLLLGSVINTLDVMAYCLDLRQNLINQAIPLRLTLFQPHMRFLMLTIQWVLCWYIHTSGLSNTRCSSLTPESMMYIYMLGMVRPQPQNFLVIGHGKYIDSSKAINFFTVISTSHPIILLSSKLNCLLQLTQIHQGM